jgi:hypothetical protein
LENRCLTPRRYITDDNAFEAGDSQGKPPKCYHRPVQEIRVED